MNVHRFERFKPTRPKEDTHDQDHHTPDRPRPHRRRHPLAQPDRLVLTVTDERGPQEERTRDRLVALAHRPENCGGEIFLAIKEFVEEFDVLSRRLADAETALREIGDAALQRHLDWMHFHEVAIADPFKAESEAQAYAAEVRHLACAALGGGTHE